jgi:hypothetical protein
LLFPNDAGDLLCKKCLLVGEKLCDKCGNTMPAGYGKSCWDCYWSELLEKRIKMGCQMLNHSSMKERFRDFGYWLFEKNGSNQSAIKINKLLPFFQEIDDKWKDIPKFKDLVDYFGANKMRHFRLPMQWFEQKLDMIIDEDYKLEVTEKGRIDKYLSSIDDENPCLPTFIKYKDLLLDRVKEKGISIRSVRLTLSAAHALIQSYKDKRKLDQHAIDQYLIRKPGQKANLTGFINYLNKVNCTVLILRIDEKKAQKLRKRKLRNKLLYLITNPNDEKNPRKWLLYSLQYFHNLPMKVAGSALKNGTENQDDDGVIITWKDNDYFIPSMSHSSL